MTRRSPLPIRIAALLLALLVPALSSCAAPDSGGAALSLTDSAGNQVRLSTRPQRVVALSSSLADLWLTAGGTLAGATDDSKERDLWADTGKVASVGALMKPNAERIVALKPDLVLYSPDIPAHKQLAPALAEAGVPCFAVSADTFDEYLAMLKTCCTLTGREDLYAQYGAAQQEKIGALLARVPKGEPKSVLFLRAYSSGVKAIASEHVACDILEKSNTVNIAASDKGLLQDLSLEAVVRDDPDYILVITMGENSEKALASLKAALSGNPAWAGLSAVKAGRFFVLPKDLYQYKPNKLWSRAYEYLLQTLYPEAYGAAS